ncbi:MAG: electron transfer flavoprotein subunit alpha/FixB family protein [Desulfopila sp.]
MILGVMEFEDTTVSDGSLQMITWARGLAAESGEEVVALLIGGDEVASQAETLGQYGITSAITVASDRLVAYAPLAWARVISQVMAARAPALVIAAGTDKGNEFMTHLAVMDNLPLASNCCAVTLGEGGGVTRLRWGGGLLEESLVDGGCKLVTMAMHTVEAREPSAGNAVAVESFTPTVDETDLRVRLVGKEVIDVEGVTLKTADVVIGGGRGVGSAEAYSSLEELAALLGGAVGCSRVATNNGWRPHADQVGLTGTRISPKIYIACGISGAIQHLSGCKGSEKIMVINKDPEAAFFRKADYGVVGDLHEVIPAVIAEVRKSR